MTRNPQANGTNQIAEEQLTGANDIRYKTAARKAQKRVLSKKRSDRRNNLIIYPGYHLLKGKNHPFYVKQHHWMNGVIRTHDNGFVNRATQIYRQQSG
jgi:hypothetical protein